ncbi:MAG TPA: DUF4062 domain-containing protein [Blastocatellia bacterium]|nr:DUF4062 domain-containing protein [Blastocatellia bacterium]
MATGVRVFISSTCSDLEQDCRPAAIKAAGLAGLAVTMERWITDFANSVQVCKQQIVHESNRYIGIFAYRRGWVPEQQQIPTPLQAEVAGKSITEAEFDWALQKLKDKSMAIFFPHVGTPFDTELRQRANNQSPADAAAQEEFRHRVRNMGCTVSLFDEPFQLGVAVGILVDRWSRGSLREVAQTSSATPQRAAFSTLGRLAQVRACEDCLRDHISQALPEIGCFLIHGPAGYGHEELLQRLQNKLSEQGEVLSLTVDAGVAWRGKDVPAILEVLSKELNESFATVSQLATRLKQELTTQDVVLRCDNLQRLNISLATFIQEFWQPLAQSFSDQDTDLAQRLICLASFKGTLDAAVQPLLFAPDSAEDFDKTKLIALPALDNFTENDLFVWLKQQKMPPLKAKTLAAKLMQETGGNPPALFQELLQDALWND